MRKADAYGVTPWGERFVAVLERCESAEGRIARGKRYASEGAVASFRLEDSGQAVVAAARVAGNARPWYEVRIAFEAFRDEEAARVRYFLASKPAFRKGLEAGRLEGELLELLDAWELRLEPVDFRALLSRCDCPDRGHPCKHIAALYYALASEVDRDPRLLFRLRGIDLEPDRPAWRYRLSVDGERKRPAGGSKKGGSSASRFPDRLRRPWGPLRLELGA